LDYWKTPKITGQFEATVIADYDAQSAVERELVLRLASILWRLRRATTFETGLFAIEPNICVSTDRTGSSSRIMVIKMQHKVGTLRRSR
jgi:hypothetical protein